ncbi:MAG TPA: DUF4386 family protein [Propionibacteriaceae bacterium]|nr:DUF4386 family protein [Propionibacteriaceae bacterium]
MTTRENMADSLTGPPSAGALNLKAGGVCAIVGAVVFAAARLLHGDPPAADPEAALHFLASRSSYPAVHITAVYAAVITLVGQMALASSLRRPAAWLLGRAAVASEIVGLAIFGTESTSEGLALSELAHAAATAEPAERAGLVQAARAVAETTHGPSLVAMALLIGVPLLLFGLALVLDAYPSWLGWFGMVVGVVTVLAATGLYLAPTLLPGALLYGVLGSLIAQLWLGSAGAVMLRRATGRAG